MVIEVRDILPKKAMGNGAPGKVPGKVFGSMGLSNGSPVGVGGNTQAATVGQPLGGYIGRPRLEEVPYTFEATKPWETGKVKMSRATWYRRRREALANKKP